jgi:dTDP-glucose 4,6-dehydratase
MKKTILITGGCGFVGHHFIEHFLKNTDWDIITIDKLSYASKGFNRVKQINVYDDKRVTFLTSDLSLPLSSGILQECENSNIILHLAAESHVDNSITNPIHTINSNIMGTVNLLEMSKRLKNLEYFCYFSTDEVFGPAPLGINYKENDRYDCTNPYSASKASSEQICLSYEKCYNIPVFITRSMNIIGERQHPEKFVPLCIRKILNNDTVTIHSSSDKKVSGSRFYIHARNVANAIHFLLDKVKSREMYHIRGEEEWTNLQLAEFIAKTIGKPLNYKMVDFHSSRPGHDLRYAITDTMPSLGWERPINFKDSLIKTIKWTLEHPEWYQI